ncbi:MAG TPA: glycoside hydrolase family 30 beta sandwich domain-containing protein [Actinocrinis sp.]|nr:glycoside hydrolase family 30 beta sandwich domain-containing protein [Actinocrinis sp.]
MDSESVLVGRDAAPGRRSAREGAGPSAGVWLTTPDALSLLRPGPAVDFEPRGPDETQGGVETRGGAEPVVVDSGSFYQGFLGCGASITDSSASLLGRLPAERRDAVMAQLFCPASGIGLSYLRQPIGSSAFVSGPRYYTCDDVSSGHTDFGLAQFSIARDEAGILPLLRQARALNPQLKVMATPWSAPAWMKTNGSLVGGELIDAPRYYEAYAAYLVEFVKAYERAGVPIHAVTLQNEPQNRNPDVPGMHLGVAQAKRVIHALGPALRHAGLATEIVAFDHNWAIHPDDLASVPPGQSPEEDYPFAILSDPATARWVAGTAFHCYYGDPEVQSRLHDRFPDKDVYFTECSGSRGSVDSDAKAFADTLRWHASNVVIGATRHWARTVVTWNLALDPSGGPHANGYTDFSGLITIEDDDSFTLNAEYYALAHLSRFVRPGARRVESRTRTGGDLMSVAFRDEDGTIALLLHNTNDDTRHAELRWNGRRAALTLPGGSLATLTWPDQES